MKLFSYLMVAVAAASAASPHLVTWLSSPLNDYNLSYARNGTMLVFARSEAEFKNARIYFSEREAGGWTRPAPVSFAKQGFADSDPWLSPDGRTLYFISDRPAEGREAGRTDYDIWRSRRSGSGWSSPERLGSSVNSRGQELGPEVHGETLYFSSARRGGLGGLDIYRAPIAGNGFGTSELLEGPFNSAESDSDFTINPRGDVALFWRLVGGKGLLHLSRRVGGAWSPPKALPPKINIGDFNFTPSFSRDGRRLYYASTPLRAGQESGLADIYEVNLPEP
jgi:Tol biopolymer transport system component